MSLARSDLHKKQSRAAPLTAGCASVSSLIKGNHKRRVPVICATKHLPLSRGLSGRPPALCPFMCPQGPSVHCLSMHITTDEQSVSLSIFVLSGKSFTSLKKKTQLEKHKVTLISSVALYQSQQSPACLVPNHSLQ